MEKPYKVVVSPGIDFYLNWGEVCRLKEMGQSWACNPVEVPAADDSMAIGRRFTPSQDKLPRHDKVLIELTAGIKRFDIIELEVKVWPPKYFILNTQPMGGEELFEPYTIPWKTVYYPEEYTTIKDPTEEDRLVAKIRSIAP